MKTVIDASHFIKAVSYTSEHYFSKPYGLKPIVDRWFNQKSVILLDNQEIIHLSGKDAIEYSTITISPSAEEVIAKIKQKLDLAKNSTEIEALKKEQKEIELVVERLKNTQKQKDLTQLRQRERELCEKYDEIPSLKDYGATSSQYARIMTAPVLSEISRLGRSVGQIIQIVGELIKHQINFIAIKENIHLNGQRLKILTFAAGLKVTALPRTAY